MRLLGIKEIQQSFSRITYDHIKFILGMQELFDSVLNYIYTFKKQQLKGEHHTSIPLVITKGFDTLQYLLVIKTLSFYFRVKDRILNLQRVFIRNLEQISQKSEPLAVQLQPRRKMSVPALVQHDAKGPGPVLKGNDN